MQLENEFKSLAAAQSGNKEVAVFYFPGQNEPWIVMVGNDFPHSYLGECPAEFEASAKTLREALDLVNREIQNKLCFKGYPK